MIDLVPPDGTGKLIFSLWLVDFACMFTNLCTYCDLLQIIDKQNLNSQWYLPLKTYQ